MKAFVLHRDGGTAVVERPVPRPRAGEVLVRTTAALLCAWDGHLRRGMSGVLGHEAVGVVVAAGSPADAHLVGRRVAAEGRGRLAEYFRAPAAAGAGLTPVPAATTDHQALYAAGALATGFATAEGAGLPAGGTVAVFGQGAVGLCAAVAARRLGAGRVIAVEPGIRRQRLALRFGADVVVDPAYEDSAERITELTEGAGAAAAVVATGTTGARTAAYRGIRTGGRVAFAQCRRPALCFSRSCNGAAGLRARYGCVPSVERMTWGVVSPGPWGAVGAADERPGHRPARRNAGQNRGRQVCITWMREHDATAEAGKVNTCGRVRW